MTASPVETFRPRWWLRGPHGQSILPSSLLRQQAVQRRSRPLRAAARELLLDCGDDVRLQSFHSSPSQPGKPEGEAAAVLLHGWEGSADSLYVQSLGQSLFEHGYEVVRLNLRDHGATHHLNRELFHSCRLPEVIGAVRALQHRFAGRRLVLVGFSLGGNFMLRVGAAAGAEGLTLERIVAVSPLLDPASTLDALEQGLSLYEQYFVLKWSRSLRQKQAAWPGEYDFAPLIASRNLRQMTRDLVLAHTGFTDLESYLAGYAITGARLSTLAVPSLILTALDDPMIPPRDLQRLARRDMLEIVTTERGGHCGFLETLRAPSWIDRVVTRDVLTRVPLWSGRATS